MLQSSAPVHNELTLYVQLNSFFFQAVTARRSVPTLHQMFRRKTLFLVIRSVSQKSKTNHTSKKQ